MWACVGKPTLPTHEGRLPLSTDISTPYAAAAPSGTGLQHMYCHPAVQKQVAVMAKLDKHTMQACSRSCLQHVHLQLHSCQCGMCSS